MRWVPALIVQHPVEGQIKEPLLILNEVTLSTAHPWYHITSKFNTQPWLVNGTVYKEVYVLTMKHDICGPFY